MASRSSISVSPNRSRHRSPETEAPTLAPDESSLTTERAVLGTIAWMSPEQTEGKTVDSRSDIFAFGVLMYEMLTGRHPFRRDTTIDTIAAIRERGSPNRSRTTYHRYRRRRTARS